MHRLMWELIPSLEGKFTPNHKGELQVPTKPSALEPDTDLAREA